MGLANPDHVLTHDAGLLVRTPQEKKRFLVGSKQVNDYDLSDKGRSTWTADASQPGYGNFCFGHREVSSVDSFTPPDADATQYTVNYHDTVTGLPDWASSAEMNTAFPKIAALTSGQQTATATLVKKPRSTDRGFSFAVKTCAQISRITGMISGRRLVFFWMYRFRSMRIFSLITP